MAIGKSIMKLRKANFSLLPCYILHGFGQTPVRTGLHFLDFPLTSYILRSQRLFRRDQFSRRSFEHDPAPLLPPSGPRSMIQSA